MSFLHPDKPDRAPRHEGAYISPSRLARHWDVHINTIYRDIRKGALKASRLPGGQFRILLSDARAYGRPIE
jgi:predicted site-specific integrase-resolvase